MPHCSLLILKEKSEANTHLTTHLSVRRLKRMSATSLKPSVAIEPNEPDMTVRLRAST